MPGSVTDEQYRDYLYTDLFPSSVIGKCLPSVKGEDRSSFVTDKLKANIWACCRDDINLAAMKWYIHSRERLDLEQAAAVIISAIVNDLSIPARDAIVKSLIGELDHSILVESCMWINDVERDTSSKFTRFTDYVQAAVRRVGIDSAVESPRVDSMRGLVATLVRIRRHSNANRSLFIPEWMFTAADIPVPTKFRAWDSRGTMRPGSYPASPNT